jgi:hypothetical protein
MATNNIIPVAMLLSTQARRRSEKLAPRDGQQGLLRQFFPYLSDPTLLKCVPRYMEINAVWVRGELGPMTVSTLRAK